MANHKSTKKSARKNAQRRLHNRYYGKTTRNAMRGLVALTESSEAEAKLPEVFSMIDKLAKRNVIHKNKANRLKSQMQKHLNSLSSAN